jgi:hypothetical protein
MFAGKRRSIQLNKMSTGIDPMLQYTFQQDSPDKKIPQRRRYKLLLRMEYMIHSQKKSFLQGKGDKMC